jgi:hypothetical protein
MPDAQPTTDPLVQPPVTRDGTGRRVFCLSLAALAAASPARAAAPPSPRAGTPPPEPFPDSVQLLVAGPSGGRMDQWADAIGAALARALPPGTTLDQTLAGGADGVTAANQFEARVAPDGQTALLLPGDTPLAWLTGDPRARFDAASWLPVMTGLTPGVLASRVPGSALRPGSRLRVATSVPAGPELAALLGLDLMGVEPVPVFGLRETEIALAALRGRVVDAVFLTGPDTPALLAAAAACGAAPLFTLGMPTQTGLRRDPLLPEIATALELAAALRGAPPTGALAGAWRSAAAAAQIEFALVLPPMTPAALVAQWRCAGVEASRALRAQSPGVRLLCAPEANAATAAVAAEPAAMLELRRWLAARFNWTPS